jgi:hypothetical protein
MMLIPFISFADSTRSLSRAERARQEQAFYDQGSSRRAVDRRRQALRAPPADGGCRRQPAGTRSGPALSSRPFGLARRRKAPTRRDGGAAGSPTLLGPAVR